MSEEHPVSIYTPDPDPIAERYTGARTCECGALIEEIDGGNSYTYWAHVKSGRIQYDHAAVPVPRITPSEADLEFARKVLDKCHDDFLPHYLIGVIRAQVGMGDNPRERPAAEMVRQVRAAIIAYDERRDP